MSRYFQIALLPVPIGLVIGIVLAATVIDTQPAILGWAFGTGIGLMGGAFVAAISSGSSLVSGPAPKRGRGDAAPWLSPPPSRNGTTTEDDR